MGWASLLEVVGRLRWGCGRLAAALVAEDLDGVAACRTADIGRRRVGNLEVVRLKVIGGAGGRVGLELVRGFIGLHGVSPFLRRAGGGSRRDGPVFDLRLRS